MVVSIIFMEVPWNDPCSNKFVTIIWLITSSGSSGPNIMACEWTHNLSYKPELIAISLGPTKLTARKYVRINNLELILCIESNNTF